MKKHKGILAKRSLRPVKEKKSKITPDIRQELQCEHCKTVFPDYLARCPECGSENIQQLRRVTGYLTGNYTTAFNKGKQDEVHHRVKHQ